MFEYFMDGSGHGVVATLDEVPADAVEIFRLNTRNERVRKVDHTGNTIQRYWDVEDA